MNQIINNYIIRTDRGKELDISEPEWTNLNSLYSQEELIDAISDCIGKNSIILPTRDLGIDDADLSHKELVNLETNDLILYDKWFSRYEYELPKSNIVLKCSKVGNVSSDFFHQDSRFKCDSINSPSPYRSWNTEPFRKTLLKALWSMKYKSVNTNALRSIIGLRKYIASQFRPSTTKAILNLFNADSVLDFSMGWGDRLAGFMASSSSYYFGIDPNMMLVDGYNEQIKRYGNGKTIRVKSQCAEDIDSYNECENVDLVFTSPPYFNVERYSRDDKQSYKKYKGIDNWLDGFLFKSINNAWSKLKPSGHLVINISDVYSGHKINKICDPMNKYIKTLASSDYVGCYGYQMMKRPNSGALLGKEGIFAEPMWIWKKL
jgi:hypothetical protein